MCKVEKERAECLHCLVNHHTGSAQRPERLKEGKVKKRRAESTLMLLRDDGSAERTRAGKELITISAGTRKDFWHHCRDHKSSC